MLKSSLFSFLFISFIITACGTGNAKQSEIKAHSDKQNQNDPKDSFEEQYKIQLYGKVKSYRETSFAAVKGDTGIVKGEMVEKDGSGPLFKQFSNTGILSDFIIYNFDGGFYFKSIFDKNGHNTIDSFFRDGTLYVSHYVNTYDADERLIQRIERLGPTEINDERYTYQMDQNGTITSKNTMSATGTLITKENYTYNAKKELIKSSVFNVTASFFQKNSYEYDAAGFRV